MIRNSENCHELERACPAYGGQLLLSSNRLLMWDSGGTVLAAFLERETRNPDFNMGFPNLKTSLRLKKKNRKNFVSQNKLVDWPD